MDALMNLLLENSPSAVIVVSLVKATLVLTIAQLIVSSLPRLSAATKHLLLTVGLAAFVVIPLLALFGPEWRVAVATAAPAETSSRTGMEVGPWVSEASATPSQRAAGATVATGDGDILEPAPAITVGQAVALVWILVSLLLLFRLAISFVRVRRIVRDAVPSSEKLLALLHDARWLVGLDMPVRVLESDRISVPMVWGVRRGTLLLPSISESWSPEDLRATLIHELGHLQRFDYLSLTFMNVVSALVWFHPQVWSARRRALSEGERACDDLVLRAGERPSRYASHLLHVAGLMPRRDRLAPVLAMSRPSQLEGRMYAILSTAVNRHGIGRKAIMSSLAFFAALVIPLSIMQFTTFTAVASPVDATLVVSSEPLTGSESLPVIAQNSQVVRGLRPDPSPRVRGTYAWTTGDTGTCADHSFRFNDDDVALAEESLSFNGRQLHVTAADNGGIRLRRSTTGNFTITACMAAGGESPGEAQSVVSRVAVQERGGAVTVDGPEEGQWTVHLIVGVPDGHSITALGKNGPVSVDSVDAAISAEVVNGPLSATNSRGEITLRAVNGPLSINGLSGNVEASVMNGPLTVKLEDTWVGGELRARVENGPLSLNVPRHYGSGVLVKTRGNGPLACSLPECAAIMAESEHPSSWRPRDILLGSGSTRVYIEGGNGPVAISEGRSR